jgi:uncharacterized membrane protein
MAGKRDPAARRLRVERFTARTQAGISILLGVVAGVITLLVGSLAVGALVGLDVADTVYMTWVWSAIWWLDADESARLAQREDPTRTAADVMLLSAALVSLVAVGFVIGGAAKLTGGAELERVGLGLASVVLSWGLVHTIFTLRYAQMYYAGSPGGVDFNTHARPAFSDFAYLALTIGMTFQVSDTDLHTIEFRRTALRHALLSYVFGVGIVATTINLIASLTSK